jgi:hypothetical protein
MIIDVSPSLQFGKRYVASVKIGDAIKKFHFGQEGAFTYIDGAPEYVKDAYWARHMGNAREKYLINNLIPSPALFSAYLLWGSSRSLATNIRSLNKMLKN